jgi:hypothetical protein
MKIKNMLFVVIAVTVLASGACNKAESTPEAAVALPEGETVGPGGSLQGATGLALGTLKLEGTEHAVTPAQAAEMLPLWKAIQGGSLQGAAETEAVLKQIQGLMDEGQLAAIDEMSLSSEDVGTWMQSPAAQALGVEMPARPGEGEADQGQPPGGRGLPGNMNDEQRSQLRQEFENMTDEQRATRMAEMGFERPEGGAPGGFEGGQGGRPGGFAGRGGGSFLVGPLIELLTERAAE